MRSQKIYLVKQINVALQAESRDHVGWVKQALQEQAPAEMEHTPTPIPGSSDSRSSQEDRNHERDQARLHELDRRAHGILAKEDQKAAGEANEAVARKRLREAEEEEANTAVARERLRELAAAKQLHGSGR